MSNPGSLLVLLLLLILLVNFLIPITDALKDERAKSTEDTEKNGSNHLNTSLRGSYHESLKTNRNSLLKYQRPIQPNSSEGKHSVAWYTGRYLFPWKDGHESQDANDSNNWKSFDQRDFQPLDKSQEEALSKISKTSIKKVIVLRPRQRLPSNLTNASVKIVRRSRKRQGTNNSTRKDIINEEESLDDKEEIKWKIIKLNDNDMEKYAKIDDSKNGTNMQYFTLNVTDKQVRPKRRQHHFDNSHRGHALKKAIIQTLTSRPLKDSLEKERLLTKELVQTTIKEPDKLKKIKEELLKKMIISLKTAGTEPPPVPKSETPHFVKKVKKKQKIFKVPKFISDNDLQHVPLYSMHGPPYDHYHHPAHPFLTAFPPPTSDPYFMSISPHHFNTSPRGRDILPPFNMHSIFPSEHPYFLPPPFPPAHSPSPANEEDIFHVPNSHSFDQFFNHGRPFHPFTGDHSISTLPLKHIHTESKPPKGKSLILPTKEKHPLSPPPHHMKQDDRLPPFLHRSTPLPPLPDHIQNVHISTPTPHIVHPLSRPTFTSEHPRHLPLIHSPPPPPLVQSIPSLELFAKVSTKRPITLSTSTRLSEGSTALLPPLPSTTERTVEHTTLPLVLQDAPPFPRKKKVKVSTEEVKTKAVNEGADKKKIGKELSKNIFSEDFQSVQEDIKESYPKRKQNALAKSHYSGKRGKSQNGLAGIDYPTLAHIPLTDFTCRDHESGIYADMETGCQVWHMCEADGRQHSFMCPNCTIFNQQLLTCDWWYKVDCEDSFEFYKKGPNAHVFKTANFDYDDKTAVPLDNDIPRGKSLVRKQPKLVKLQLTRPLPHPPPKLQPIPKKVEKMKEFDHDVWVPSKPPHFVEFVPYYGDKYPMFHLSKHRPPL